MARDPGVRETAGQRFQADQAEMVGANAHRARSPTRGANGHEAVVVALVALQHLGDRAPAPAQAARRPRPRDGTISHVRAIRGRRVEGRHLGRAKAAQAPAIEPAAPPTFRAGVAQQPLGDDRAEMRSAEGDDVRDAERRGDRAPRRAAKPPMPWPTRMIRSARSSPSRAATARPRASRSPVGGCRIVRTAHRPASSRRRSGAKRDQEARGHKARQPWIRTTAVPSRAVPASGAASRRQRRGTSVGFTTSAGAARKVVLRAPAASAL